MGQGRAIKEWAWDTAIILFLAKRRSLAAINNISSEDFQTMFPTVAAALSSLHPVIGGRRGATLKFIAVSNLYDYFK